MLALEVQISSLRRTSLQGPDSLLEDPLFVFFRSCFPSREVSEDPVPSSKFPLSLEVLTPSSRRPYLQGANFILQGAYDFEFPFISEVCCHILRRHGFRDPDSLLQMHHEVLTPSLECPLSSTN